MNKYLLLLLVCLVSFSVLGCATSQPKSFSNNQLIFLLKKDLPGNDNFKLIQVKDFRNGKIALFSYDLSDGHHVDYRLFKVNGTDIRLLGGGGGIAKTSLNEQLSIGGGGSISNMEGKPYFISYGEVYNKKIEKIQIVYSNGKSVTVPIVNGGFLAITEEAVNGVKSITALDNQSKIIYSIP